MPLPDPAAATLRQTAARIASERYADELGQLAHGPTPAGTLGRAEIKAGGAQPRRPAKLGKGARNLAPDTPIHRLTEAAVERLVDVGAVRGRGQRPAVSSDDARLIEILAGPDVAWRCLGRHRRG